MAHLSYGQFNSIQDGDWNTVATWGSGTPGTVTAETINIYDYVTLVGDLTMKSGGTLNIYDTLEVNNLVFKNGSHIFIDTDGVLIVNGNLTNRNNSDDVVIDGNVTVSGIFKNGNGGDVTGSGVIFADDYTGRGTTFGYQPNSTYGEALPVTFLGMSLEEKDGYVWVIWDTASETNNDYFTIDKSEDLVNWNHVATVTGQGNTSSTTSYEYVDLYNSNEIYYRLMQTDYDGTQVFLQVKPVHIDPMIEQFQIYPNPVGISEFVIISGSDITHIRVVNLEGKSVHYQRDGNKIKFFTSGIYLVRINNTYETKIIVK